MNCIAIHSNSKIGDIDFNLNQTLDWINFASQKKIRFVLFPELNLSGYTLNVDYISVINKRKDEIFETLCEISLEKKIAFAVGFPEMENGKFYVAQCVFDKGKLLGIHRKTHLGTKEKEFFTEGNEIKVFTVDNLKIGIQICYESHFTEISFAQEQQGANLLAVAFATPGTTIEEKTDRFMRFLPARAYDNTCYLMTCNLSGQTDSGMIIHGFSLAFSPRGELLESSFDKGLDYCCFKFEEDVICDLRESKMAYFNKSKRKELFTRFYEGGIGYES